MATQVTHKQHNINIGTLSDGFLLLLFCVRVCECVCLIVVLFLFEKHVRIYAAHRNGKYKNQGRGTSYFHMNFMDLPSKYLFRKQYQKHSKFVPKLSPDKKCFYLLELAATTHINHKLPIIHYSFLQAVLHHHPETTLKLPPLTPHPHPGP